MRTVLQQCIMLCSYHRWH